jgi:hypothetical protein
VFKAKTTASKRNNYSMSTLDRDPVEDLESSSSNDNDPESSPVDTGSRSATEEEEDEKIKMAKRKTTLFPPFRLLVFLVLLLAAIIVSLMVTVMVMSLAFSITYCLIAGIGVGVLTLFTLSIVGIEKIVFRDPDAEEKKEWTGAGRAMTVSTVEFIPIRSLDGSDSSFEQEKADVETGEEDI